MWLRYLSQYTSTNTWVPYPELNVVECTCNLSVREAETGKVPALFSGQPNLLGELQHTENLCYQKMISKVGPFIHVHAHIEIYMYTQRHTCTHRGAHAHIVIYMNNYK